MEQEIHPEWTEGFIKGSTVAIESILGAYRNRMAVDPNGSVTFADLVTELEATIPMIAVAVGFSQDAILAGVTTVQAIDALMDDAHETGVAALDDFMEKIRRIESHHADPAQENSAKESAE